MGKPPRKRLRVPEISGEHGHRTSSDRPDYRSGAGASDSNFAHLSSGPSPDVNDVPSARSTFDDLSNNLVASFNESDLFNSELLEQSLAEFTTLDFGDNFAPPQILPRRESYIEPWDQTKASKSQAENLEMPAESSEGHDCFKEAYDILGRLSFLRAEKTHSLSQSLHDSGSMKASTAHEVPFDQILRINRQSNDKLRVLLTCNCARFPNIALLYASIISLILKWYQQAASCKQRASENSAATDEDIFSCNTFQSGWLSGSQSPWSSTAVSSVNATSDAGTPTITRATSLAIAPMSIAMGSFDVDDQQVQTALTFQLLLSEIKRTGSLIDRFTPPDSSDSDEFTSDSVDHLYKSLSPWLKREYVRIAELTKSRLREVST